MRRNRCIELLMIATTLFAVAIVSASAQIPPTADQKNLKPAVMWESVDIKSRDLFLGPGGSEMLPDTRTVKFIKEEEQGHNKKYRIEDASGRIWVAKPGREAQPETAAVRLLWGIGFKSEINYLVKELTIPGIGTFKNVRLEARPKNVKRLDTWSWTDNPFIGTRELEALKIMQVFIANWDVLDLQNKVLAVNTQNGTEYQYVISDLGSTFGKLGNNNMPVIYRLGRKTGDPKAYLKGSLVNGVGKDGKTIDLAYKGKNREIFEGISLAHARWLAGLLLQLDERQIRDAFRAANYTDGEIDLLTQGVKKRIAELDRLTAKKDLAIKGE